MHSYEKVGYNILDTLIEYSDLEKPQDNPSDLKKYVKQAKREGLVSKEEFDNVDPTC
jgi:hypothetical protein